MKRTMLQKIHLLYGSITKTLIEKGLTITTMESCTSGLIASFITDTEGSSAVLKGAFITYSNEAKTAQGVPGTVIEKFGVYSDKTAEAMAAACRKAYSSDIGIGITGSFGNPDPNNADSVIGSAYFSIVARDTVTTYHLLIPEQKSRFDYKIYAAMEVGKVLACVLKELEEKK